MYARRVFGPRRQKMGMNAVRNRVRTSTMSFIRPAGNPVAQSRPIIRVRVLEYTVMATDDQIFE